MRLQSTVFCDRVCDKEELYFRKEGEARVFDDKLYIQKDSSISTNTYLNLFDATTWYQYTGIRTWKLQLVLSGTGRIRLFLWKTEQKELIQEITFCTEEEIENREYSLAFELKNVSDGVIYYQIDAYSEVIVSDACYCPNSVEEKPKRDINISLIICTYHRNAEITHHLQLLENSKFYDWKDVFYNRMRIIIVDNASELEERNDSKVCLLHNANTGGSGGFIRGIQEVRKKIDFKTTNVIFMDDDVEFMMESFYRLVALLCYLKEEYQNAVIAGRMFRMDKREIQYTAVEIWNSGDLIHIGENVDMTKSKHLLKINQLKGEYTGWWFGCFPMEFVAENDPLPFFLHCDDVEYGLRHGGNPIVLNGIQVWHETYEYRQTPIIKYYDTRNVLYVNEKYGLSKDKLMLYREWKSAISKAHLEKDWITEYMMIRGLLDYMKGWNWLKSINSETYHKYMMKQKGKRWRNAFLWRYAALKFRKKYRREMKEC